MYILNLGKSRHLYPHFKLGTPFAVQNSTGAYILKENNEIFYYDTKLVCLTDSNTAVSWYFQESTLESATFIPPNINITNMISEGISILTTTVSSQGFYSCNIVYGGVSETYTAGVFNSDTTTSKLFPFISILFKSIN